MTNRSVFYVVLTVAAASASVAEIARGDITYLATQFETLYRLVPDRDGIGLSLETFDLGRRVRGLHYEGGTVFGIASEPENPGADFVIIDNAVNGVPSVSEIARLDRPYGGITKVGDLFYGFSGGGTTLYSIDMSDPENPVEKFIGENSVSGNDALAYDSTTDTLYAMSKNTDTLYEVDRATAALTYIGHLGINGWSVGAEWFDDHLYMAVQNGTSGDFEIGEVDTETGVYGNVFTLAEGGADYVATGLAIVPEPATAILLVTVVFAISRRRRS